MSLRPRNTLSNPIVFEAFRNWVYKHKSPEADSMVLEGYLNEARKAGADLTYQEALAKVREAQTKEDVPWSNIASAIDWFSILQEEEQKRAIEEAANVIKEALSSGLIEPSEVGLYTRPPRPTGERLPSRAREQYERRLKEYEERIQQLQKQVEELKARPQIETPEQAMMRRLEDYIQRRVREEGLSSDALLELYSIINPRVSFDVNIRAIETEIQEIKRTERGQLAPLPQLGPPPEMIRLQLLKDLYQRDPARLKVEELVYLINTLLQLQVEGLCDQQCEDILNDYFRKQEEIQKTILKEEQKAYGIMVGLRYSARLLDEKGKIVSDNLFQTKAEAQEKAEQIQRLIDKGIYRGKVIVVDTFEEQQKGLA